MFKRMITSLVTSVGLFSLNAHPVLAERAVDFIYSKTLYPSTCNIVIAGETYRCTSTVMGAFDNASANIKLCSSRYCLILILSYPQLVNASDGENFYVRQLAWQKGRYITDQWDVSLTCGLRSGMGCIGKSEDGSPIAIYVE
ncbi:hypothetical protein [Nostoc sp.]|uniref:hypothetical protein n=1 Tax=Nostoc sp. TaxID=1180 RepID=UPI002FF59C4C